MPASKKLTKHLDSHRVKYELVPHKKVYTALDVAATLRARLEEIAKSLVIKADRTYYLLILSANKNVNLAKLKKVLKAKQVMIPKETELVRAFKIKPGGLTGFGSMHQLPVVVDKAFEKINRAIFSGGSLVESIRMKVGDYIKLEEPIKHAFGEVKKIKPKAKKSKIKKIKQTKNKKSKSKKKKS